MSVSQPVGKETCAEREGVPARLQTSANLLAVVERTSAQVTEGNSRPTQTPGAHDGQADRSGEQTRENPDEAKISFKDHDSASGGSRPLPYRNRPAMHQTPRLRETAVHFEPFKALTR